MTPEDEELEGDHEPGDQADAQDAESGPKEANEVDDVRGTTGFWLPSGFAQSLLPDTNDLVAKIVAPWQTQMPAQMKSLLPDVSAMTRGLMGPLNQRILEQMKSALPDTDALARMALTPAYEQLREQMASISASLPTFSVPMFDVPSLRGFTISPATEGLFKRISEQHSNMLEGFRASLGPLFDPEALRGLNRALLPPNLKDHAYEIRAHEVHEFLEEEGVPLYLVPRGKTALRLLRASDRAARRRVLGDCYESLIVDCAEVLEAADNEAVSDEVRFALDGLGAMRAGHTRSAQAMFTVTLDTLIYRFYPDRKARGVITNRKKGADVPDAIDEMGVREAMVWLPIWNAHEEFWKHKGDNVPHYYSRHATVHGVSSRQFSKRNCVQVLMLVTSLIGYADRIAREAE